MTTQTYNELSELGSKWLALEGADAAEIHGWLIGLAVAIERKRNANPAESDFLIAELRASTVASVDRVKGPAGLPHNYELVIRFSGKKNA